MPWIRNIYIVTNGQYPNWLNLNHPRIKLIPHTLLFDDKKDLPTFNSAAIEVNLHKIPGLSEKFIYFNDDMLIGKPVQLSDFWIKDKGPVIDFHYPTPFCNEECEYKDIGDGLCHFQCLTKHCQYDFNDCTKIIDYYHYDLACNTFQLGDGKCDLECNTKFHGYDFGDCNSTHPLVETVTPIVLEKPYNTYRMDHREPYLIISYEKAFPHETFQIILQNKHLVRAVKRKRSEKLLYILFFKQKHEKTQFVLESAKKKYILDVQFIIMVPKIDSYASSLIYSNILLNLYYKKRDRREVIHHRPFLIEKSFMMHFSQAFRQQFAKTSSNKLRSDEDLQFSFFYHWNLIEKKQPYQRSNGQHIAFLQLTNEYGKVSKEMETIHNDEFKFICINDDMGDQPDLKVMEALKQFFESKFPKPSQFEKNFNFWFI